MEMKNKDRKVYVGNFYNSNLPDLIFSPSHVHPRDFKNHLECEETSDASYFTNNLLFVNEFDSEQVMVAGKPLNQHKDWPRWKDEFHPGEFWSMFGEEWVDE